MRSLASRANHPLVWDSVNWELSTTYFTLATLLQDYAPLSRKAQEQVNALTDFHILIISLFSPNHKISVYHLSVCIMCFSQIEREVTEAMMKSPEVL